MCKDLIICAFTKILVFLSIMERILTTKAGLPSELAEDIIKVNIVTREAAKEAIRVFQSRARPVGTMETLTIYLKVAGPNVSIRIDVPLNANNRATIECSDRNDRVHIPNIGVALQQALNLQTPPLVVEPLASQKRKVVHVVDSTIMKFILPVKLDHVFVDCTSLIPGGAWRTLLSVSLDKVKWEVTKDTRQEQNWEGFHDAMVVNLHTVMVPTLRSIVMAFGHKMLPEQAVVLQNQWNSLEHVTVADIPTYMTHAY